MLRKDILSLHFDSSLVNWLSAYGAAVFSLKPVLNAGSVKEMSFITGERGDIISFHVLFLANYAIFV